MSAPARPDRVPERTAEVVASIAQHRALSTEQVGAIHYPGNGARWIQRVLARIEGGGPSRPRRCEAGAASAVVRDCGGPRSGPRLPDSRRRSCGSSRREEIAGPFWSHTLAVNDAAIAFLRAARDRGDDFGPLSWRQEVAHPVGPKGAPFRRRVVADALLTYVRGEGGDTYLEQTVP